MEEPRRLEIKALSEKKKIQTKRLKEKLKYKNNLCSVNDALLEKLQKLNLQLQEAKDNFIESSNCAISDTEEAIQKLSLLNQNILEALEVHDQSSAQGGDLFPSRVSADEYFQAEEEFAVSLTGFTKRQFFEGIADMAGSKEKLRYEILEVSRPETLLIRGESEEFLKSKCKELQRLQSVYAESQTEKFEAHCNLHRVQACLYKTEDLISKLPMESPELDAESLSSEITDLQNKCEEKSRCLQKMLESELTPLINEMSELQTAKILSGNFDLKIARQDYFISKQEEVIEQLLEQNSRYEFLSILYEMEAKSHRDTYHLLSSAKSILSNCDSALQKRIIAMKKLLQERKPRETIDSRDHFLQNLFKVLEPKCRDKEKRPFVTFEMLQSNFQLFLGESMKGAIKTDSSTEVLSVLDKVKEQLDNCKSLSLGTDTEISDQSHEQNLSDSIAKIEDVIVTIEKSVKSVISEIDKKKKILASDSLKALERTLFTNFFNDPTRMKRILAELKTRVEAVAR